MGTFYEDSDDWYFMALPTLVETLLHERSIQSEECTLHYWRDKYLDLKEAQDRYFTQMDACYDQIRKRVDEVPNELEELRAEVERLQTEVKVANGREAALRDVIKAMTQ